MKVLRRSLSLKRFPTSCAVIVGGATLIPNVIRAVIEPLRARCRLTGRGAASHFRLMRLISTFLCSLYALRLLNNRKPPASKPAATCSQNAARVFPEDPVISSDLPRCQGPRSAGKTVDLTLFVLTRALSVLALRPRIERASTRLPFQDTELIQQWNTATDSVLFSAAVAIIMYQWLYFPDRLPSAFNKWIEKVAEIDPRILQTLRLARTHEWRYGVDNSQVNHLLRGVAKDLSLPERWGDPAVTVPVKCELIHSGCGSSCEIHALWRFWRGWLLGMRMYIPLQIVVRVYRRPSLKSASLSIGGAAKSSAFLGSFLFLFYYGVCLARTRLGPLFYTRSKHETDVVDATSEVHGQQRPNTLVKITPQSIDSGLCVLTACSICGWSILVETPPRRAEIAMFVAPRALATLLPRTYDWKYFWKVEALVFALSVTTVLDVIIVDGQTGPARVRGVFGRVLRSVLLE